MGAANESLIYAGAMIVSIIMLTVATTFSSAMLEDAYSLMEVNHARYQSVQATYLLVGEGQNYNMTRDEFWNRVSTRSSNDQCQYVGTPQQFTYLADDPSTLNTTGMNVTAEGTISNCEVGGNFMEEILIDLIYPSLATAMDNPGNDPGRWELIKTFPYNIG